MLLPRRFIRQCRRKLLRRKIADSSGAELTGGNLLLRTLILRRILRRHVLAGDEQYVGVLLPPSVGGVVVNAALTLDRRISVNLNYTLTSDVLNHCIRLAKLKHVLTSRRVVSKLDLKIDCELVYLEDFKDKATLADKVIGAQCAFATPAALLERMLGLQQVRPDDVMTIIFTSGSTGQPKGVMLSHGNVLFNVEAIEQLVHVRDDDVMIGVLPFFHSFGYSVTLWGPLGTIIGGAYHFSPLDAKEVGKLVHKSAGTILLCTPTFLRNYVRRCSAEEFKTLEIVVLGAEKMPLDLADSFEQKFALRPLEGYGTTELSPLVALNNPPNRAGGDTSGVREGTVGRPVPRVSVKVVDPATFADLGRNTQGMLLVKGPNVMLGYLDQPEKTAEVIRDGWYMTGDLAIIDDDGFIRITGRQSRFSKIGGEMVPHVRVEEEIQKILGQSDHDDQPAGVAVTGVPDPRRGERLIVLHTELPMSPDEITKKLAAAGLPNLWIPSTDSFYQVEQIPILGTGKLDLHALRQAAVARVAAPTDA